MFKTNDQLQGWDGTFRDEDVQTDVFVFIIEYTNNQGEPATIEGNLL